MVYLIYFYTDVTTGNHGQQMTGMLPTKIVCGPGVMAYFLLLNISPSCGNIIITKNQLPGNLYRVKKEKNIAKLCGSNQAFAGLEKANNDKHDWKLK